MELPLTEYSINVLFPYFSLVHLRSSHMRVLGAYFFQQACVNQKKQNKTKTKKKQVYSINMQQQLHYGRENRMINHLQY